MKTASYYIDKLQLLPHPEGGYFKEVFRDQKEYPPHGSFSGPRNYSTSIYYLLEKTDFSSFHRIQSDETWHHYDGGCILIHYFENQELITKKLGKRLEEGEHPQHTVPKNTWFAAEPAADCEYALMGCTVAPGFDFRDFELAMWEDLKAFLSKNQSTILRLIHK
jgi:hypothetical protein